jgi:ubiquinone/menaquinone biosynthesis C-methylase UbiE
MRYTLIPSLVCPDCQTALEQNEVAIPDAGGIFQGSLKCALCDRLFPIEEGILRAMPASLAGETQQEIQARDEQVVEYDKMIQLALMGIAEIPITFSFLRPRPSSFVLEAGCGTGRMTRQLSKVTGKVVAADFSFESLRVNRGKLLEAGRTNVNLVQADLCHLPFKDDTFNRVLSCQVLEHTPNSDASQLAVDNMARVSRKDAILVISAYQKNAFTPDKEGKHRGGIPYFRFTRDEIAALLGSRLQIKKLTGVLIYMHLAQCIKKS